AVCEGEGEELASRPGRLSRPVRQALFSTPSEDFPMERVFGKREPTLFQHPDAARYVQEFANHCVAVVQEGFEDESAVDDLSREGGFIAGLAVLLVLAPCRVPPRKVESWRKRYHAVRKIGVPSGDVVEDEFEKEYGKCLERTFRLALKKFAT